MLQIEQTGLRRRQPGEIAGGHGFITLVGLLLTAAELPSAGFQSTAPEVTDRETSCTLPHCSLVGPARWRRAHRVVWFWPHQPALPSKTLRSASIHYLAARALMKSKFYRLTKPGGFKVLLRDLKTKAIFISTCWLCKRKCIYS